MSLEEAMNRLADVMENHTKVMTDLMKGAGKGASADAESGTKPGRKGKSKDTEAADDTAAGDAVDAEKHKALITKAKGWLKEFAENEADPENEARGEKLKKALKSLGVESLSKITTEDHRSRADKWLDKVIAEGRITPDPKGEDSDTGGDEDEI